MGYQVKTLSQLRPILLGFRKAAGLTQAAMAAHLGVTQQTYAQLEANPAAVSVERLFKVMRVLGVNLMLTRTAENAGNVVYPQDAPSKTALAEEHMPEYNVPKPTARKKSPTPAKRAAAAKKRENW
ncbi:XRE family transcriptional regulator [Caballeronia terrestris]|uniref:XRE family transcriptional regulator n=1 Tax=Caballeronia terrestris TaxID=1226301 RepID=A0A158JAQ4_9BURK|nr:helix-turn-helix transcriptional regulator [Caballeronia terrestris]SAL65926.1 XRE family transcriptional regulator [Caballeronia terrestris]